MAVRFADTVEEIVRVLDEAGEAIAGIARNMEKVAGQARKMAESGGEVVDKLDGIAPAQARVDGLKNGFEDSKVAKPLIDTTADTLVEDGKQQAKVRDKKTEFAEPPSGASARRSR